MVILHCCWVWPKQPLTAQMSKVAKSTVRVYRQGPTYTSKHLYAFITSEMNDRHLNQWTISKGKTSSSNPHFWGMYAVSFSWDIHFCTVQPSIHPTGQNITFYRGTDLLDVERQRKRNDFLLETLQLGGWNIEKKLHWGQTDFPDGKWTDCKNRKYVTT